MSHGGGRRVLGTNNQGVSVRATRKPMWWLPSAGPDGSRAWPSGASSTESRARHRREPCREQYFSEFQAEPSCGAPR